MKIGPFEFTPVDNWRAVSIKGHSMWSQYLQGAHLLLPEIFVLVFAFFPVPPWIMVLTALGIVGYGVFGRLKDQGIDRTKQMRLAVETAIARLEKIKKDHPKMQVDADLKKLRAALAACVIWFLAIGAIAFAPAPAVASDQAMPYSEAEALGVAVPFIAGWEGLGPTTRDGRHAVAYRDIVGVVTICYGHTRTAVMGQIRTIEQCEKLLREEVREYRDELLPYFAPETRTSRLTPARDAAYVSLAFNVGWVRAGRSTATRRLNNGNIRGGCYALGWWNKAGGRVVRGLVNRRAAETALCLQGLDTGTLLS